MKNNVSTTFRNIWAGVTLDLLSEIQFAVNITCTENHMTGPLLLTIYVSRTDIHREASECSGNFGMVVFDTAAGRKLVNSSFYPGSSAAWINQPTIPIGGPLLGELWAWTISYEMTFIVVLCSGELSSTSLCAVEHVFSIAASVAYSRAIVRYSLGIHAICRY